MAHVFKTGKPLCGAPLLQVVDEFRIGALANCSEIGCSVKGIHLNLAVKESVSSCYMSSVLIVLKSSKSIQCNRRFSVHKKGLRYLCRISSGLKRLVKFCKGTRANKSPVMIDCC